MVCMYCGSKLDVKNSRHQSRSNHVWRRRTCSKCGAVFTTHEKISLAGSIAVKADGGTLSPFNRDKLLLSIYKSCGHRKHSLDDSAAIADTVTTKLSKLASSGTILKSEIIDTCISVLQNFDNAAVVQYQAYHPL